MKSSSVLQFLYILLASSTTVALAYWSGSNGLEMFYVALIGLCLLSIWFSAQLLRYLYSLKTWLIAKIILTMALILLLGVMLMIAIASMPINLSGNVNGWLVLLGVAPFIIPRLGVYKKIERIDALSVSFIITLISLIILFIVSYTLLREADDSRGFLVVLLIQFQFVYTYLALQTNYLERSRAFVLSVCRKWGVQSERAVLPLLLATTGLPFIVPIIVAFAL